MGFMRTIGSAGGSGIKTGFTLLAKIRFSIFFVVFFLILINAIIVSVQAGSIEPGITEVGGSIAFSSKQLNDESIKIINNDFQYNVDKNVFSKVWNIIKNLYPAMVALLTIFAWLNVFMLISRLFLAGDSSRWLPNFFVGLILLIGSQIIFLLAFQPDGITKIQALNIPIYAMINFIKAIPFMFAPFADIFSGFSKEVSYVNSTI